MPKRTKNSRMCVFCREKKDPSAFLRIVRLPDGTVTLDETGRLNGRGAYICPSSVCLEGARKSRVFDRALKISVPESIYSVLADWIRGKNDVN